MITASAVHRSPQQQPTRTSERGSSPQLDYHANEAARHRFHWCCSVSAGNINPFVYPCHCGLCPHIVDCKTKVSAECFCGTAAPGTYPHPADSSKFWMCSFDSQALVSSVTMMSQGRRALLVQLCGKGALPDSCVA
ncbi:hypothetical protein OEZ85_003314 [Tetradesmus obliquus]|uniref:Uncharacterized protein n=1 Tax=Tetradesmus obliquus TaxID=3088 RepID=A0ABY8UD72_TETOB|nr:hypothetical protein OEZ85_003314 [Tetradesmus obliquus]